MIPDELQDQAALYALGGLEADERARFEDAMDENAELRAMVREMREASAELVWSVPLSQPPAQLKQRVLREVALEKQSSARRNSGSRAFNWIPWAIAALLLVFCGMLALDRARLQRQLAALHRVDPLAQATLITLASPSGEFGEARVIVAWQPDQQSGVITINHLRLPGQGRDYQLWAVDANHKDPISAGLIHLDPNGTARIRFKPTERAAQVKAFAISLEREGGVPKREGPIILIGNA
jgi:anti-sigma-K factor RskA